ncbi:MAG: sodium:calcium antiporter [Halobacteriaceae archaeon]
MSALGIPGPWGNVALLLGSFVLLLIGAEVFTNGIEWFGHRLGVSESATGSILAAVGTALPETMIPVIAILQGGKAANEVGVGAILGAPFMLATIAMFLIGSSVLYFKDRRVFGAEFHFNAESTRRDLLFFLGGYTLALLAALVHQRIIAYAIGGLLIVLYLTYLVRTLRSGELIENEDLDALHFGHIAEEVAGHSPLHNPEEGEHALDPGLVLVALQTAFALGLIIGGAHAFVSEITWAAGAIGIPEAVLALLIAPLATELPEKFNSVLWISRDKDTLAIGNITGAMAFQGTLPVTLGIVYTSWNLTLDWGTAGFLNAFSAILAIISGLILYYRARSTGEGNMNPRPFLIGGAFYLLFIVVLIYHVSAFDLAVTGGH